MDITIVHALSPSDVCRYIPYGSSLIPADTNPVQKYYTNEFSYLSPYHDVPHVCRYVPHNSSLIPLNDITESTDPSSSHKRTKVGSISGNIHSMKTCTKSSLHALTVSHISSTDLTQMEPSSIHDAILSPH